MKESQSVRLSGGFGKQLILSDLLGRPVVQDPVAGGSMPWLHTKSLSLGSCNEGDPRGATHPRSEVLKSTAAQSRIGIVQSILVSELEMKVLDYHFTGNELI